MHLIHSAFNHQHGINQKKKPDQSKEPICQFLHNLLPSFNLWLATSLGMSITLYGMLSSVLDLIHVCTTKHTLR